MLGEADMADYINNVDLALRLKVVQSFFHPLNVFPHKAKIIKPYLNTFIKGAIWCESIRSAVVRGHGVLSVKRRMRKFDTV